MSAVKKPARASTETTSNVDTPARATEATTSIEATPARVPDPHASAADWRLTTITLLAEAVDDLESARIAATNRAFAFAEAYPNMELPPELFSAIPKMLAAEKVAVRNLERIWRTYPLAPWSKSVTGIGDKSIARLIALTGDPADRDSPASFRQFCGHGSPERVLSKLSKGASQAAVLACGSRRAKKQVFLISEACVKANGEPDKNGRPRARSPYRDVYDERKARTVGKLHEGKCKRCGPSGHPALPGSPWSDAHRHADAYRIVGKRFLLDLWREAVRLRDESS